MRPLYIIILYTLLGSVTYGQRVMWWNVENLFDCRHDSLKEDYDFLPEGSHRWTPGRYWRKLDNLSRTVAAIAGEGTWPMAIGMCEVENDSVLFDLTRRSPLRAARYAYVHEESPDVRGIDVALLYDSLQLHVLGHRSIRIPSRQHGFRPTRDILHVWGLCHALPDTLHFVLVHLPSRAGSGRQGTHHRRLAMEQLCNVLDSLTQQAVIVMGDFNAEPDDVLFKMLGNRVAWLMPRDKRSLRMAQGTYVYRGLWGYLDYFFASPRMLPHITERAKVARFDFLLNSKGAPWRTFRGPVYEGGFSDHLPIWVDLSVR